MDAVGDNNHHQQDREGQRHLVDIIITQPHYADCAGKAKNGGQQGYPDNNPAPEQPQGKNGNGNAGQRHQHHQVLHHQVENADAGKGNTGVMNIHILPRHDRLNCLAEHRRRLLDAVKTVIVLRHLRQDGKGILVHRCQPVGCGG